ncbi:uncharacterized protein G2W53_037168 [Senna tora]|uniref:Uncharacterized protein n=1 Tax=Senna tora TaxID=362788 RepID=A0A834W5G1_9FABA|nr:uncharacterized protein G2W53_037168 [Senna tora]
MEIACIGGSFHTPSGYRRGKE